MKTRAAFIRVFSFIAILTAVTLGGGIGTAGQANAGWLGYCGPDGVWGGITSCPSLGDACASYAQIHDLARADDVFLESMKVKSPTTANCKVVNTTGTWEKNEQPLLNCSGLVNPSYESGCQPKLQSDEEELGECPTCNTKEAPTKEGNPINVTIGNKFEKATDYRSSGGDTLQFTRYYNSLSPVKNWQGFRNASILGYGWRTNYDRYLVDDLSFAAEAHRPDGQILTFVNAFGTWRNFWGDDEPLQFRVTATGWELQLADDTVEVYDSAKRLAEIRKKNGYIQTINRDAGGYIASVVDSHGRTLAFTYAVDPVGFRRLDTMIDPEGNIFQYKYLGARPYYYDNPYDGQGPILFNEVGGNVLSKVIYPDDNDDPIDPASYLDNPFVEYLYEDWSHGAALTGIVDETGQRTATFAYDANGRATLSEHAGGTDRVTVSYNADGTRTATGPLGVQRVYTQAKIEGDWAATQIQRLASPTTPAAVRNFTYDINGFMSSSTDWNGVLTYYTHNSRGLQTSRTEAVGTPEERVITTAWHATLRIPTQIVAPERATDMTYDTNGLLLTRTVTDTTSHTVPYSTAGQTRTWTYTYNAQGLVETVDGPRTDVTDVTTYAYDATTGDLVSTTNALGRVTQITAHDASGRPIAILAPNGVIETTMTYDARGRLLTRTEDATGTSATTTFAYDLSGQMTAMTLPDGSAMVYEYDAADRLTAIENGAGERIEYAYDDMGNRTSQVVKDASLTVVRQASSIFDDLGRLLKSLGAYAGEETDYAYDHNGNRISMIDPLSNVTASAFDSMNRLVELTDALGGEASYSYDDAGNSETATDQRGLVTSYVHNGFGEVIQQSSPDTGATIYEYDPAGNRTRRTDARGVVTEWTYDGLNRVLTESYPASPAENVEYYYLHDIVLCPATVGYNCPEPGRERLGWVNDSSGSASYDYDTRGNIVRVDTVIDGESFTTEYTYDLADRIIRIDYPGSTRFATYARDSIGRVTDVTTEYQGTVYTFAENVVHEPFGPVASFDFSENGLPHTRTYDLDGRVTSITTVDDIGFGNNPRQDLSYSYDLAGNATAIADAVNAGRGQAFGYDALHRLVAATGEYGAYGYAYDAVGNRTERTRDPADTTDYVETLAYDPASNRLETIGIEKYTTIRGFRSLTSTSTHDYTYDTAGNVTNRNRTGGGVDYDFVYGDKNRLSSVSNQGAGNAIYGYVYDAAGRRVQRQKTPGVRRSDDMFFLYDLSGRLLEVRKRDGSYWTQYFRLDGMLLVERRNGTNYRILTDHLGTPQKYMDHNGQLTAGARLRPFGDVEASSSVTLYLRLPGQYDDPDTQDLYQNGFRDYDPWAGRYIQSDPIGLAGGWNTYGYVGGNPVMRVDPEGLDGGASGSGSLPDTGRKECKVDKCKKDCLADIFGQPAGHITLYSVYDPFGISSRGRAVTGPGWIRTNVSCDEFWADEWLVLHEYYHVLKQWPRFGGSGGTWFNIHSNKKFEAEANNWATRVRQVRFKRCLGDCGCPSFSEF